MFDLKYRYRRKRRNENIEINVIYFRITSHPATTGRGSEPWWRSGRGWWWSRSRTWRPRSARSRARLPSTSIFSIQQSGVLCLEIWRAETKRLFSSFYILYVYNRKKPSNGSYLRLSFYAWEVGYVIWFCQPSFSVLIEGPSTFMMVSERPLKSINYKVFCKFVADWADF